MLLCGVIIRRREFGVARALQAGVTWFVSMWAVWVVFRLVWIVRRQLRVALAPW